MNLSDKDVIDRLNQITGTLKRSAGMVSSTDRMIYHYRDLAKEKELEIEKLKDDLHKSFEERKYASELYHNQYRNSTQKSFYESPSPKTRRNKHSKNRFNDINSTSLSNIDISEPSLYYHSTPKNTDDKYEINFHLKRIHEQMESDQKRRHNHNEEMESLTVEIKKLKEAMEENNTPKQRKETIDYIPDSNHKSSAYKRKFDKQQLTIESLQDRLKEKEIENSKIKLKLDDVQLQSKKMKLLEEKLMDEESERMKVIKEADEEREKLLFALSEVKNEAKTILTAYKETSQTLPELRTLLELSAKQKSEFSEQVTKLQNDVENYREEINRQNEQLSECSSIINNKEADKQRIENKFEELHARYFQVASELKERNEEMIETKEKLSKSEKSKNELKMKALTSVKSYRLRCRKYEKEIEEWKTNFSLKETELEQALSQTKELEDENILQREKFEELANRMVELQGSISLYVERFQQVSDEKDVLEITLSQQNDLRGDYHHKVNEQQLLIDELNEEKEKRCDFEKLCREYYESTLTLKQEKSVLEVTKEKEKNELLAERNQQLQIIDKLKEQCNVFSKDVQLLTENNENLIRQLKASTEYSNDLDKRLSVANKTAGDRGERYCSLKNKSDELVSNLKALTVEKRTMCKEFEKEKQTLSEKLQVLSEKLSIYERTVHMKTDENSVLQKELQDSQLEYVALTNSTNTIIDVICNDASHLMNLLCQEEENTNPERDLSLIILPHFQADVKEVREKIQSCFSIIKVLIERYHQQFELIKKAKDRVKSQDDSIQNLTNTINNNELDHKKRISSFETKKMNDDTIISELQYENKSLVKRNVELAKDLETCTKTLNKSLGVENERKAILTEIDTLNKENRERQKIDESINCANEEVELISEQLSEAKLSFCEIKKNNTDSSYYADQVFHSLRSISPNKSRMSVQFR